MWTLCNHWDSKWKIQSMRNVFELHQTFCSANHGSLVGHFGISPDISCQVKKKTLIYNFFAGHFAQFPYGGHFVWREFTPLHLKFSPDMSSESGAFRALWKLRLNLSGSVTHKIYWVLPSRCGMIEIIPLHLFCLICFPECRPRNSRLISNTSFAFNTQFYSMKGQ